jgi:hypothetical protein
MPSVREKPSPGPRGPRTPIVDKPAPPPPSTPSGEQEQVGISDSKKRKIARRWYWLVVIGLAVIAAVVIWITGLAQRGEFRSLFRDVLNQEPQFELIEARDGVVLLTRSESRRSEVIVKLAGQTGWRYASNNDFTAKSPALSPSGAQVAYLSEIDEVHIEVVSLITDTRQVVTAAIVDTSLSVRQLAGLSVCAWSPVRWSPDPGEEHLAFFVCTQDPLMSYAAVVDLSSAPPRIVWLEGEGVLRDERSLIWLDSTHLLMSTPVSDGRGIVFQTVEVIS